MGSLLPAEGTRREACRPWWIKYYVTASSAPREHEDREQAEGAEILKDREGRVSRAQADPPPGGSGPVREIAADLARVLRTTGRRNLTEAEKR